MNIDVVMITKNSLKPCLYESITSILRNIPLNKLIIIDSYSNDGTIESIKLFKNINIIIVQNECGRGKAREIGIKNVETEWFAFIDSDVILEENWFSNIEKNISNKIGAIEGNVKSADGKIQKIQQYMRGYTNCTLIRTNLVKDINIPFAAEVQKILDEQCMTIADLSFDSRVQEGTIRKIIARNCDPRLSTAKKIAKALNISLDDLPEAEVM